MGENCKAAGFPDVEPMVAAFVESENAQLEGMARFIAAIGADKHLRAHNWPAFAAAYNGRPMRRTPTTSACARRTST